MSTLPLFGRNGGENGDPERVYRVGQLNRLARLALEDRFRDVWVEGELSDVSRPGSGHIYFTLNDEREQAQLRGVMFRSDARRAKARMENGERVKLRGALTLFEPRGSFQMVVRIALPTGLGELHAQFEAVRKKLDAEGLLAPERKRPLPKVPRVLGVVTSEHGAALHDIVQVASGRCPVRIVVSACLVQGPNAPRSIIVALQTLVRLPELDVVIVGRGGGAAEDLVAFNDERVARAIAACPVPVVSAVGHEVDVTISDLVADVRAATPSNAAELCVPDRRALLSELAAQHRALQRAMDAQMQRGRLRLMRSRRRLLEPRSLLARTRARLEALTRRLTRAMQARLARERRRLSACNERVRSRDPRLLFSQDRARLHALRGRLVSAGRVLFRRPRARLGEHASKLHALSPLSVLARGYAIALHERSGRALLRAGDAEPGDVLRVRLHEGELRARVEDEET